jgi:hypothetical protein
VETVCPSFVGILFQKIAAQIIIGGQVTTHHSNIGLDFPHQFIGDRNEKDLQGDGLANVTPLKKRGL